MVMWQELGPGDPGRIGPYRLRGLLGTGGMGRVFLGAAADGQLAAVKVIRLDLAADPEFRARFRREVTLARKVNSRFTAQLLGADVEGPVPWLATAYVAGPSLADAVAEGGPLSVGPLRELAAGLAEGLSAIHAAGVVHRDLKPSNVLLAKDGPRVIDFGISVAADTSPLTRTGMLVGSPGYMSPEHVEGRDVGPASDIFSLGAVLAFAVTGEGPFGAGSAPTLAYRVVYHEPSLDHVPVEVRGLIQRCLAKDPARRPTARDLVLGAGATQLSGPVTPTVVERQEASSPTRTVTSARLAPDLVPAASAPAEPGRHRDRRERRLTRPLAIASMIVGLMAASAAGGIALAASAHQVSGAHSGQAASGRVSSPATSAPAVLTPTTSPTAVTAPSASASATATPTTATPTTATPTATSSPAPTATSSPAPTASSSPAPATSPSAGASPAPTGQVTPSPAAS
jgi:eukaryotic-like serine/threonine-protein kinase